jgi:hypothetical protein
MRQIGLWFKIVLHIDVKGIKVMGGLTLFIPLLDLIHMLIVQGTFFKSFLIKSELRMNY